MVKLSFHYFRATNFAVLVIGLVAWIGMLTGLLYLVFAKAASSEGDLQAYLVRMAWITGAVLILSVVILAGLVVHYVASRISEPPEEVKPMGYVDAWSESARRLKAKGAPPVEPDEEEDT